MTDDALAADVAEAINEAFTDPEVTGVVAVFEDDIVEFDASDIGNIQAIHGTVHGMIRETPEMDTFEELRVRSKPWLAERLTELEELEAGDTVVLDYVSRFGSSVQKEITISDVEAEYTDKPYGLDVGCYDANLDMVAAFGFKDEAEFGLMAQSNGGVNILMNDTRVIEPGTYPTFEVVGDE